MNTAMFAMIQLCVSVQHKSDVATRRRQFSGVYGNCLALKLICSAYYSELELWNLPGSSNVKIDKLAENYNGM